eukprot:scaffold92170_cov36-Phaeocystis_antarctica.AAC.2
MLCPHVCPLPHPRHHRRRRCVRTPGARLLSSLDAALALILRHSPGPTAASTCTLLHCVPPWALDHASSPGRVACVPAPRAPAPSTRGPHPTQARLPKLPVAGAVVAAAAAALAVATVAATAAIRAV